ncbi:MAG: hypothetical protein CW338_02985 [Clostridiales bacterium]|nr:hypothetical protein [Clostridiales bacterium]
MSLYTELTHIPAPVPRADRCRAISASSHTCIDLTFSGIARPARNGRGFSAPRLKRRTER